MLPPLYSAWMGPLLGAPVPEEREATCESCAMRALPGQCPDKADVHFTESKCCTYHPRLPNFLVGRILDDDADGAGFGRSVLEQAISAGLSVTPLCITASPAYWLLYRNASDAFGRSQTLRCPLFQEESGHCGAWRHRISICATWYCKFERGALGFRFWAALRDLLQQLERAVALHCLTVLDPGDKALALALAEDEDRSPSGADLDRVADRKANRLVWGRWSGREREFYGYCKELAEALTPAEVLTLGGAEAKALAGLASRRFADLRNVDLPTGPLRLGALEVIRSADALVRVCTYSTYDPLDVPVAVFRALLRFDGRPTGEVVDEIARLDGLAMPPEVLRTLLDHELLIRPEA